MSMRDLIGRRVSKKVKFLDEQITIHKLTVDEVLTLQEAGKTIDEEGNQGLLVLRKIIRASIPEAEDITDEEFNKFPMADLAALSTEIMKYSGIGEEAKGK